jgi:Mor family transcriptional regulator
VSYNLKLVATFMRELADTVASELQDTLGLPQERAAEIGLRSAQTVCDEFGGQLIYVPQGFALRITERDRALYSEFCSNGRDAAATARKFEISIQQVYKRIRLIEAAEYAERQGSLFDAANGTEAADA